MSRLLCDIKSQKRDGGDRYRAYKYRTIFTEIRYGEEIVELIFFSHSREEKRKQRKIRERKKRKKNIKSKNGRETELVYNLVCLGPRSFLARTTTSRCFFFSSFCTLPSKEGSLSLFFFFFFSFFIFQHETAFSFQLCLEIVSRLLTSALTRESRIILLFGSFSLFTCVYSYFCFLFFPFFFFFHPIFQKKKLSRRNQ